jgi:Domain of unknown function (DUF4331)
MSSHREAPEISKDPVADSSDLYAFVSPDAPDTVTIIADYVPLQMPAGGPNFFEFGGDVLYEIHIDSDGDGRPDLTYQFRFRTELRNDKTFLYNTGPIESLDSGNWNRRQFYSVTKVDAYGKATVLATKLACPPCNVGPLSIPDYGSLAADAVHTLETGEKVFAGQRADAFYVDLGAIFDLGTLRPFQDEHLIGRKLFDHTGKAVNATDEMNVHSIAVQVPAHAVRRDGKRKVGGQDPGAVIGVWTSASRRQVQIRRGDADNDDVYVGPQVQVSRLGNPLFNQVIVPMAEKDRWNSLPPSEDKRFAGFVERPEIASLLPVLYPGRFDNLAALHKAKTPRADLVAILLTGIPDGLIDDFQNSTGDVQADMLRLNTAIPPSKEENPFGILGGDLAGFPNGRRIADDVVSISLRAIAGATVPLVDDTFQPDAAASQVEQGLTAKDLGAGLLEHFPYLGTPFDGFRTPS